MNMLIIQKSTIENEFDKIPKDIQDMIYNKIVYPQPQKLLQEIKTRGIIYNILHTIGREKDLKPTLNNIAIAISEIHQDQTKWLILKQIKQKIKKIRRDQSSQLSNNNL